MAVDAIVAPLLRVGLFHGLKPLQITEIARHAERIVFKAGDVITEAGADGDAAYVIVAGSAHRVANPDEVAAPDAIVPASIIGEMAMLIEHQYGSTVIADGAVRALRITRDALHAQMLDDPGLARHLMDRIAERLSQVASELRRIDSTLDARGLLPPTETWLPAIAAPTMAIPSHVAH